MLTFWAGAFTPVPLDYTAPVEEQFAAIVTGSTAWPVANLLFLVGAALTAAGQFYLSRLFTESTPRRLALAGVGINVVAVLVWAVATYYRVAPSLSGGRTAEPFPPYSRRR